jgi:CAP12/Pycsar effector protein, TIR domain
MNKKLIVTIFVTCFLFSVVVFSQICYCQTSTPISTIQPTPTKTSIFGGSNALLLIGGIVAVVAVVVGVMFVFVLKKRPNEKRLSGISSREFEAWVIKKFNGKPGDPSSGVNGFTEGGQPLLIKQSGPVSLAEVDAFVKVLVMGRAQKGTIVAFDFDDNAVEGKMAAVDNGIELQLLRINEMLNKRYADSIKDIARSQVTFEAPPAYMADDQVTQPAAFDERMPNEPQKEGLKPRVFISNSNTKVSDQVMRMLDFLHYDYVMGDKEEATVPIPNTKFGLMKDCDCAIINIAAAEQERRYSGLYVINSNVISEINAAYLKYSRQVVLLVERKVELPSNLKGLKRIEYDGDDLSFNAAMDLNKALEDFKKL